MQKNQNHVRPSSNLFLFSAFLRRECKFFINTSNMHLVNSFMNLYTCLLDEIAMQDQAEGADRMSSSQVCTIWTDTIQKCYYPSDAMWVNLIRVKWHYTHRRFVTCTATVGKLHMLLAWRAVTTGKPLFQYFIVSARPALPLAFYT